MFETDMELFVISAIMIISFIVLCFYIISRIYYDFFILVRDLNIKDEIIETIDIVNYKEQKWE